MLEIWSFLEKYLGFVEGLEVVHAALQFREPLLALRRFPLGDLGELLPPVRTCMRNNRKIIQEDKKNKVISSTGSIERYPRTNKTEKKKRDR